jgi:hypothetical protein
MRKYIMDVHGFDEENITLLLDDGEHTEPTYENIINAYKTIIEESGEGDAIFLHYSGELQNVLMLIANHTLFCC